MNVAASSVCSPLAWRAVGFAWRAVGFVFCNVFCLRWTLSWGKRGRGGRGSYFCVNNCAVQHWNCKSYDGVYRVKMRLGVRSILDTKGRFSLPLRVAHVFLLMHKLRYASFVFLLTARCFILSLFYHHHHRQRSVRRSQPIGRGGVPDPAIR